MTEPVLCINCKYYEAKHTEKQDVCLHQKAITGGVRTFGHHTCDAMRAGICTGGQLFIARTLPQFVDEAQGVTS